MKLVILIFLIKNFNYIQGFVSFPFIANNALDIFIKTFKHEENIEENIMKYASFGESCYRTCQKNDTRVCYFKFQINYYQVMSG